MSSYEGKYQWDESVNGRKGEASWSGSLDDGHAGHGGDHGEGHGGGEKKKGTKGKWAVAGLAALGALAAGAYLIGKDEDRNNPRYEQSEPQDRTPRPRSEQAPAADDESAESEDEDAADAPDESQESAEDPSVRARLFISDLPPGTRAINIPIIVRGTDVAYVGNDEGARDALVAALRAARAQMVEAAGTDEAALRRAREMDLGGIVWLIEGSDIPADGIAVSTIPHEVTAGDHIRNADVVAFGVHPVGAGVDMRMYAVDPTLPREIEVSFGAEETPAPRHAGPPPVAQPDDGSLNGGPSGG